MKQMSHSQLYKLNPHSLAKPRVYPRMIGRAEIVNLAGEFYGILAAGMDHITFRILQKFEGFRVAPSAEPCGVLARVDLRPAVSVRAATEVKFISASALVKGAFNLHSRASSGVHDVCCKSVGGHGVNHGPSVREFLGMCLCFLQCGEAAASARASATANCGELNSAFQAFCFVCVQFRHGFLRPFSNFCLCDWSGVGSKSVTISQKKEAA